MKSKDQIIEEISENYSHILNKFGTDILNNSPCILDLDFFETEFSKFKIDKKTGE